MQTIKTYECGLRLVNDFVPSRSIEQIGIFVGSGSGFDLPNKDGIAHFFEHMFFKSTKNRKTKEILKLLDSFGGQHNAWTSEDITCYYGTVVKDETEKFLSILADCFFNGIFDEEEMTSEKSVVCSEIDRYEDDYLSCCLDACNKEVYKGTSFAHPILGSYESVKSITMDDMKAYRKINNSSQNVVISLSGGLSQKEAEALVEKYILPFCDQKPRSPTVYADKEVFIPTIKTHHTFVKKDTNQVYFVMTTPTIRVEDPNFKTLSLGAVMFGGNMSSRLNSRIREQEGLVYTIYSSLSSNALAGELMSYFLTNKENARKTISLFKEEIQKVLNDGFSENELESSKHILITNTLIKDDSLERKSVGNAVNLLRRGKIPSLEETIEQIKSIKLDDVNKIFGQVLGDKNFLVGTVARENDLDILELLK